jgi:hypothetical protein
MDHDANLVGADPAFTPSLCRPDVRKPAAATLLLPVLRERISAALSIVFLAAALPRLLEDVHREMRGQRCDIGNCCNYRTDKKNLSRNCPFA